jgi:meprin A
LVRKPWGLVWFPLCPPSYLPRCTSGHAFFYTGERCQALQVHSSVLGLLIGGVAGVVFLTFTVISILYQRSRQ